MGEVVALFKVFPESMENFEAIKQKIKEQLNPGRIDEEPVAFGFKALKITMKVPDGEGGTEAIEAKLKAIPGVSEAQCEDVGRI